MTYERWWLCLGVAVLSAGCSDVGDAAASGALEGMRAQRQQRLEAYQKALPDGGEIGSSCEGLCGDFAGTCYCDDICEQLGDCCADKVEVCGEAPDLPDGGPAEAGSTTGAFPGADAGWPEASWPDASWPDAGSTTGGYDAGWDGGADAGSTTGGSGGTTGGWPFPFPPPTTGGTTGGAGPTTGPVPPGSDSCEGYCGSGAGNCWCDDACEGYGDCCVDKVDVCGSSPPDSDPGATGSCEGACGGGADNCWCDDVCEQYGDCCEDYAAQCG